MFQLSEFINQNKGKKLDWDNYYGPQCVDLVQYWVNNLGYSPFWGDAWQIYQQAGKDYTQIANPPIGGPQEGDIVVWSYSYNYAGGHVAIATGKGQSTGKATDWFEVFSQNDPFNSACALKTYSFSNVVGWLRPKNYKVKLTDSEKIVKINNKIETQISDTDFRNYVRELLKQ